MKALLAPPGWKGWRGEGQKGGDPFSGVQKAELAASQQPQSLALVGPTWAQVSEFIEWVFNRKPACQSVLSGVCSSAAEPSPCSSRAAGCRGDPVVSAYG